MFEADVVESLLPELVDFLGELEVDVIELELTSKTSPQPNNAYLAPYFATFFVWGKILSEDGLQYFVMLTKFVSNLINSPHADVST